MAGTVKGIIEQNLSNSESEIARNWFHNTYRYMSQSADFESIANNWDGGGEPPGPSNPGNASWFVFKWGAKPGARRQFDCYIYVQFHPVSRTLTTGVSDPCTIQRSTNPGSVGTCGIAVGLVLSGGASPWNGTSNADGSDTKGTPVWKATGSFGYFPWTNSSGNIDHTNDLRDTCYFTYYNGQVSSKAHLIHDDDFMLWAFDNAKNNTYGVGGFGYFQPRNDLTASYATSMPCIQFSHINADAAGWYLSALDLLLPNADPPTTSTFYGGVIMPVSNSATGQKYTNKAYLMLPPVATYAHDATMHPNDVTGRFDAYSATVLADDAAEYTGLLGTVFTSDDLIQLVYGQSTHNTTPNSGSVVLGDNTTTETQGLVKWPDPTLPPGTGTNISGTIVNG